MGRKKRSNQQIPRFLEGNTEGRKIVTQQTEASQLWSQLPITVENFLIFAVCLIGFSNLAAVTAHINAQTSQQNGANPATTKHSNVNPSDLFPSIILNLSILLLLGFSFYALLSSPFRGIKKIFFSLSNGGLSQRQIQEKMQRLDSEEAEINLLEDEATKANLVVVEKVASLKGKSEKIKSLINSYINHVEQITKTSILTILEKIGAIDGEVEALKAKLIKDCELYKITSKKSVGRMNTTISFDDAFREIELSKVTLKNEIQRRKEQGVALKTFDIKLMERYQRFINSLFESTEDEIAKKSRKLTHKQQQLQELIKLTPENFARLESNCLKLPNQMNTGLTVVPAICQSQEMLSLFNQIRITCANEYSKLNEINDELKKACDMSLQFKNKSEFHVKVRQKESEIRDKKNIDAELKAKFKENKHLEKLNHKYKEAINQIKKINDPVIEKLASLKNKQNALEKLFKAIAKEVEPNNLVNDLEIIQVKPKVEQKEDLPEDIRKALNEERRKKLSEEKRKRRAQWEVEQAKKKADEAKVIHERELAIKIGQFTKAAELANQHTSYVKENLLLQQTRHYLDNISNLSDFKGLSEKYFNSYKITERQKLKHLSKLQFYALLYVLTRTAESLNTLKFDWQLQMPEIAYNSHAIRNNLMHYGFMMDREPAFLLCYAQPLLEQTRPKLDQFCENKEVKAAEKKSFTDLAVFHRFTKNIFQAKKENKELIFENIKIYLKDLEILSNEINAIAPEIRFEKFSNSNDLQYAIKGILQLLAQRLRDLKEYHIRDYDNLFHSLSEDGRYFIKNVLILRNKIGHDLQENEKAEPNLQAIYYYEEAEPTVLLKHCHQAKHKLARIFDFDFTVETKKESPERNLAKSDNKDWIFAKFRPKETKKELPESDSDEESPELQSSLLQKFG